MTQEQVIWQQQDSGQGPTLQQEELTVTMTQLSSSQLKVALGPGPSGLDAQCADCWLHTPTQQAWPKPAESLNGSREVAEAPPCQVCLT